MCSRYNLTSPPDPMRPYFGYADTPNFPARYSIAPTQPVAVVCLDRQRARRFRLMRWGLLPPFVKDPKKFPTLINARSEEVLEKPSFRNAMRWRRCLPALHDRMPVVLEPEHFESWRDVTETRPEEALAILGPAADDLFEAVELNPNINDSRKDEPGIQEPLQLSLL
jgi:putative SOS response-associated peptidase YedK